MKNVGIAHILLFAINTWKYIFKAIVFIRGAFINKVDVFWKIFICKISKILLIWFFFSQICTFNTVLEIISWTIFYKKK